MKYLGIDYGTKRIGIALSDDDGMMAFPHDVIKNDNKILDYISEIMSKNKIDVVVIGESKNYKMEDNLIMDDIISLKKVIEKEFGVEVELHPEVLTSSQAESIQGKNEMIDASAAAIILQSYIDSIRK